jgi:hypothetical protein
LRSKLGARIGDFVDNFGIEVYSDEGADHGRVFLT